MKSLRTAVGPISLLLVVSLAPCHTAALACLTPCLVDFQKYIKSIKAEDQTRSSGKLSLDTFFMEIGKEPSQEEEKRNIDELCRTYILFRTCSFTKCASADQTDLEIGLSGLNYVCKENYIDFVSNLPCLTQTRTKWQLPCQQYFQEVRSITSAAMSDAVAGNTKNATELQTSFADLCKAASNVWKCTTPKIEVECGLKAANIFHNILVLTYQGVDRFYKKIFAEDHPRECDSLMLSEQIGLKTEPTESTPLRSFHHSHYYSSTVAAHQQQSVYANTGSKLLPLIRNGIVSHLLLLLCCILFCDI